MSRVSDLLEAAAEAGRQSPPPVDQVARYGHAPVPPTLRCQECGRRLSLESVGDRTRWVHVAGAGE